MLVEMVPRGLGNIEFDQPAILGMDQPANVSIDQPATLHVVTN